MDDRLKNALEEGARNGAVEVFALHDEYVKRVEEENARHEQEIANLTEEYGDNELQYAFAQNILNGIINKLDNKKE